MKRYPTPPSTLLRVEVSEASQSQSQSWIRRLGIRMQTPHFSSPASLCLCTNNPGVSQGGDDVWQKALAAHPPLLAHPSVAPVLAELAESEIARSEVVKSEVVRGRLHQNWRQRMLWRQGGQRQARQRALWFRFWRRFEFRAACLGILSWLDMIKAMPPDRLLRC